MKKVVINNYPSVVDVNDIRDSKIYAYCDSAKNIFKLQCFYTDDVFGGFARLGASGGNFSPFRLEHADLRVIFKSLIKAGETIYEFDDVQEFLKWALDVCEEIKQ